MSSHRYLVVGVESKPLIKRKTCVMICHVIYCTTEDAPCPTSGINDEECNIRIAWALM